MSRHATPEQLAETIRLATHALTRIKTYIPTLHRWEQEAGRGYPSQTEGPTGKGDHSDPTHRAYLEQAGLAEQIHAWFKAVDTACTHILTADGQGANLLPIDHDTWLKRERDEKGEGCVVCHTYGIWSKISKAGRCDADYQYRLRHDGQDTPEDVVLDREHVRKQRAS